MAEAFEERACPRLFQGFTPKERRHDQARTMAHTQPLEREEQRAKPKESEQHSGAGHLRGRERKGDLKHQH